MEGLFTQSLAQHPIAVRLDDLTTLEAVAEEQLEQLRPLVREHGRAEQVRHCGRELGVLQVEHERLHAELDVQAILHDQIIADVEPAAEVRAPQATTTTASRTGRRPSGTPPARRRRQLEVFP